MAEAIKRDSLLPFVNIGKPRVERKLIYVLDEDNIYPGSKYYDLTVLAAQCTAKRMVPDYISAKVMKELKGEVYPCMG